MIGIDVVDHSDPLLRKRDERTFRLISHPDDQHNINQDISTEKLFWLYWAAKEAVYKAYRLPRRFDPKRIDISITHQGNQYKMRSGAFHGTLTQTDRSTFCVCWKTDIATQPLYELFPSKSKDQSAEVRNHLIHFLTKKGYQALITRDWVGLPAVNIDSKQYLTTFTHHHYLAGFICEHPFS